MNFEIVESDFQTIYKIWAEHLWPGRKSKIEHVSAISDDLSIDINILSYKAYYLICKIKEDVIGVLSGHPTSDSSYRLRGLYVREDYRNQGLGSQLMLKQIEHAVKLNMKKVWLLGRLHREPLYTSLGFEVVCKTDKFEFGPHYQMVKLL